MKSFSEAIVIIALIIGVAHCASQEKELKYKLKLLDQAECIIHE